MKIRKKLPLTIFLLVAIPLIFLSIVFYYYTSRSIKEVNKAHLMEVARLESQSISALIYAQRREVELMAQLDDIVSVINNRPKENENIKEYNKLYNSVNEFIKERLKKSTELENIFIGDKEGKIIFSGNAKGLNGDISDRVYFNEVITGKIAVSDVIESKVSGQRVIVIAAPIRNDREEVIGIVGNTINMNYFSKYISDTKLVTNGYGYLADSEGKIISHPVSEKIGELSENSALIQILKDRNKSQKLYFGTDKYVYQGRVKIMGYSIIPGVNWVLVFTENVRDINQMVTKVMHIILFTTITVLIIAMKHGMKFSKSIILPINKLTETMSKAAGGDLSAKCDYTSNDEFGQLSNDFNVMLDKLNISYEELTAVYEELTATEEELRTQYEELQENESALSISEEKYRLALEGANDVIWEWNLVNNDFFASDKWTDLTGYKPISKLDWQHIVENIIHPEDAPRVIRDFKKHINGFTDYYKSEFRIKYRDDDYKWVFNRGKVLRDNRDNPIKIAGSLTDISERKRAEEQIIFMAYYDTLTKLPNRTLFMNRLNRELAKSRQNDKMGALFFIDLDNFKNTNDTLGHEYGDELLQAISKKFDELKEEKDLVCRFGGDEFLILQPDILTEDAAVSLAKDILDIFNDVFEIKDKQIYITGSIGIAIYPRDGGETGALLKSADAAMYRAKELGKNKYMFFNKNIHSGLKRKIAVENVLRRAIENNELQIYYQPQYDVAAERICGFEALLRLNSKELGSIAPDEFITVAEETGLIIQLGEWCLRKACEANKRWRGLGYKYDFVAVNISSVQLQQVNFVETVKNILEEVGLEPEYLEIELTETVLMKSLEYNVKVLNELRSMGVKIALDDFGTGYSSLNYLRKIPINVLKIDKSFIDNICTNKKEEAVVVGIIQIAHNLNLDIVAEGVEFENQLQLLKKHKCDRVQGYLLSKPIPEDAVFIGDGSQK